MSYTPKQDSDVDCLHWHALNYRTAGLDAQSAWVELEAFFDKQIKEAYQAGRASRDAEVEALTLALQTERTAANRFAKDTVHWIEKHDKLLEQQLESGPHFPVRQCVECANYNLPPDQGPCASCVQGGNIGDNFTPIDKESK